MHAWSFQFDYFLARAQNGAPSTHTHIKQTPQTNVQNLTPHNHRAPLLSAPPAFARATEKCNNTPPPLSITLHRSHCRKKEKKTLHRKGLFPVPCSCLLRRKKSKKILSKVKGFFPMPSLFAGLKKKRAKLCHSLSLPLLSFRPVSRCLLLFPYHLCAPLPLRISQKNSLLVGVQHAHAALPVVVVVVVARVPPVRRILRAPHQRQGHKCDKERNKKKGVHKNLGSYHVRYVRKWRVTKPQRSKQARQKEEEVVVDRSKNGVFVRKQKGLFKHKQ